MRIKLLIYTAMLWAAMTARGECPDIAQAMEQQRFGYARALIAARMEKEPYSVERERLEARLGDTYFFEDLYARACEVYADVEPEALTGDALVNLRYRYGYALMQRKRYEEAEAQLSAMPDYAPRATANAALFYRGYMAFTQGDLQRAQQLLALVDENSAPGNVRDFYLAQIQYRKGNATQALKLARHAASMNLPAELAAENNRITGESLYLLDRADEAIPYLERYVARTAEPAMSALYILGLSRYSTADYEQAIKDLTPVARGNDAMAQSACLYIGQAQLKLGNSEAAVLAFDKAIRMDADDQVRETAYYNYAVALTGGGRVPFGSSVSTFENFLREYPQSSYAPQVREYIVNGYITDRNYDQALRSIESVSRPGRTILAAKQRVLYALGARDLASGHPVTALDYLRRARKYSEYDADIDAETYLLSGDAHYRLESYSDAINDYRRYLAMARPGSANIPLAHYNLGYACFADKEFGRAAEEFGKAAASESLASSVRADASNRIGDSRYYARDFAGALTHYRQAYDTNPSSGDYALFQTAAMQGNLRDYNGKIATLSRLTEQFPRSALLPSAYLEKAETYLQLGRPDEAVDTYRVLVKSYPNTAAGRNGYLQLAQTLENRGMAAESTSAYQDIVRRYPSSDEARLATVALKRAFAEGDRIDELVAFLQSVPGAPELDPSEVEKLAFDAAEDAYINRQDATRLAGYLRSYPGGAYAAQALGYLVTEAFDNADDENALIYAGRLIEDYPDSPAVEDALAVKAEIMLARGETEESLDSYRRLLARTSDPSKLGAARLGIMRVARELGHWTDVVEQADALLASTVAGDGGKTEAVFSRGEANERLGREREAIKDYKSIASQTDDIYGARAAVALGQLYLDAGNLKQARKVAEAFVAASTPHSYWLARGFILLSDVNRAQGKTFEADEYLTALRRNYPGDEQDIFLMIDRRLNDK